MANDQPKTIMVLGDSLSAGYGIEQTQGWVSLWSEALIREKSSWKVVNASISGETSYGGLSRLPALLEKHRPNWVIIELGANDALRGQSLMQLANNLEKMIALCLDKGSRVLLLGIRLPPNYGAKFDEKLQQTYQNVATKTKVALDPFFLETVALKEGMMQNDGLHPTALAQPLIMNRVVSWFDKHQQ